MSLTKESVVAITGAASGIGRALTVRLSKESIAGIAAADVNQQGLAETVSMTAGSSAKISSNVVNVGNEEEVARFVESVLREHGRVTHVINNAGVALGGTVEEVSIDDIRWLMDVNFWGVVFGTKLFLPHLRKEPSAHIVNVSSIFGLIAPPGQASYCASKFAVRGFTEALRHELEGTNIAVSAVHPGGVSTNIANDARVGEGVDLTDEELKERKRKYNENLAFNTPEEAAETILKGIRTRNPRILIGNDAKLMSLISRFFPRKYFKVVDLISGGKMRTE